MVYGQGETDNGDAQWPSKVKAVYDNIVKDLGLGDDIPFLAGEVFRGNSTYSGALKNINSLPQQSKNFYVVSSEGFNQSLNDFLNVHFTTQEYRDFGARYAEKMIEVLGDKIKPVEETGIVASNVSETFVVGEVYYRGKKAFVPVNLSRAGTVNISVYSSLGKVVSNFSGRYDMGENRISLNKKSLPAGVYMLSVQVNGLRYVNRFKVSR